MPAAVKNVCNRLGLLTVGLAALLVWGAPAAAEVQRPRIDIAATYSRQAQLLERALVELKPASPGEAQLYFVGFAGYGGEAVFQREVIAVRRLFDERFSTKGRSITLINHASTVGDIPLATTSNLDRVLQHLGQAMDGDSTLVLFLTSHGRKGVLSVEMPGFELQNLTPDGLREMLDRSGIRNRIVVVSACHSGSFIPALASPTTLVMTAAHADRTSFGCGDKRQWTYFGDAYFNRALRRETSFIGAFARAKRLISRWEAKEKLTPSMPQIAGGEALRLDAVARAQ